MHKIIIIILALVIFLILWNTGLVGIRLDSQGPEARHCPGFPEDGWGGGGCSPVPGRQEGLDLSSKG